MYNFFNKSVKPRGCYLSACSEMTKEMFEGDKLTFWDEVLEDPNLDNNLRTVIKTCLIPHKISFLKYTLNKEFFEDLNSSLLPEDVQHIAPSLIKIVQNRIDMPAGYPNWFFIAFPDVALWAMHGIGLDLVIKKLQKSSEIEASDGI